MKVNKEKLKDALTIVKPGLATKEILSQTTSFAFVDGRVITYNDEISISHPVDGIDFEGAIKAEELYGLLNKINHDEINMEVTEDVLEINSGRVKAGLKLEKEINLPIQEIDTKWKKIKNPSEFQEYIQLAAKTCSSDMSIPKLTCVCIRDGLVTGSDGQRLIQCSLEEKFPTKDFLIPATNVMELVKTNPTHVQLEDDWIRFRNEKQTVFSCRRVNDVYVDQETLDRILKVQGPISISFPNKIFDILGRVMTFAKRAFALEELIEISIENNKAVFQAQTETTGSWIEERMTIKCDTDLSFTITPSLFNDILKSTKTCMIDKTLTKGKFAVKGKWEYIIMFRKHV